MEMLSVGQEDEIANTCVYLVHFVFVTHKSVNL